MGSKHSGEKASVSACCSPVSISGKFGSWKSLFVRKSKALQRDPPSSDLNQLGQENPAYDVNPSDQASQSISDPLPSDLNQLGQDNPAFDMDLLDEATQRRFDVFLSFRGTDTRNTFTDHLYNHLISKGIFVFKDDKLLEKGGPISRQLLQAIGNSRVSIVVFSKDYAASTWCLEEMAAIAQCKELSNQTVFSVFYDVDPSHVRHQTGEYTEAFNLHTQKFKQAPGTVRRWQTAMMELAHSVGWDVRDKPEFDEIKKIVQEVSKKLDHEFLGSADDLIGTQPRVQELENLLQTHRVLGIWGMGGIGKTTYAAVLYDRISHQFGAHCFIENLSKIYEDGGAFAVHKQILCQTLGVENLETYPRATSRILSNRLRNVKVLLVLDNVTESKQLEELAINPELLDAGSRIIITTRNEHILKVYRKHVVHEVPLLNYNDSLELFRRKAFRSDDSSSSCSELIPEFLKYAQGLPLAIRVMGSFLCDRDAIQWGATLERLQNNPDKDIMNVLRISFEELGSEDRDIFLHIACFFKGEREDYVKRILNCCGLNPEIGIQLLIEKSLITIRNQEIHMHDLLQDLGENIVKEECSKGPGFWSRLWTYKDFRDVMTSETGTNNVKAIVLNQKEDVSKCSQLRVDELSKMKNLRLLILHHTNFSGSLNSLSNCLQYFFWHGYPFDSLPLDFQPETLVELNIPDSSITQLWKDVNKNLPSLKRMDLSNSKHLIETPDFEGIPKLKRLDLTGCTNLLQVHPSIGLLKELVFLSLRNCSSLVNLDIDSESKLSSLRVLHLSGCTKLENTPNFTGLSNIEYLDLEHCTNLTTVHESVGILAKLKFLSLRHCRNIFRLPNSINTLRSLITLDLWGCLKLTNLPLGPPFVSFSSLNSLISLDVGFCSLSEVPRAIRELRCLERLNLEGNNFVSLPYISFPHVTQELSCLAYLNLSHCLELQYWPELPSTNASSVGSYFETASGARNHRSGLYVFNCPKLKACEDNSAISWLTRLALEPRHFRCGFDIIIPGSVIPKWFNHKFKGGSIIKIDSSSYFGDNWIGFAFCVAFEVNSPSGISDSQLPHAFYLSFESEIAEESFDMPLRLDMDKVVGSKHLWLIYISQPHCHFVKRAAHITFKACPSLNIREWGLRMVCKYNIEEQEIKGPRFTCEHVTESSHGGGSIEPKLQLPYNWLVTKEEENENMEAKQKENNLSNMGL